MPQCTDVLLPSDSPQQVSTSFSGVDKLVSGEIGEK